MENDLVWGFEEQIKTLFDEFNMGFYTEMEFLLMVKALVEQEIERFLESDKVEN